MTAAELDRWCAASETLRREGRLAEAMAACDRALKIHPDHPRALSNLAHALRLQGRFGDARSAARRALAADKDFAPAWFNLGAALSGLKDHHAAVDAYRQALRIDTAYAEAWSNLGVALGELGQPDAQIGAFERALQANASLAPVWSNLGNALRKSGRSAEAVVACRKATEIDPGYLPAWVNLGSALHEAGQAREAVAACERALDLDQSVPEAWLGLGNALQELGDRSRSIEAFEHACRANPRYVEAHLALGLARKRAGAFDLARASFRCALEIDPESSDAAWSLSLLLLALGEFGEGWQLYESRWSRANAPAPRFPLERTPALPPFAGRVLVWGEQGLGDEILYCRLAAEIVTSANSVTLEVDRRLVPLFGRSLPKVTVVARHEPPALEPDAFDQAIPAASLGRSLRPAFESFPRQPVALKADPQRVAAYARALRGLGPAKAGIIGVSWRSKDPENGTEKSAPLADWGAILSVPGACFVNLQYGDTDEERARAQAATGGRILSLAGLDLFDDIDGVASLASACDLVITTSNVTAHIAGALGRPVWLILPLRFGRIWYWFIDRADSPWYPSMRIFSQAADGTWGEVIASVARELRAWLASRATP